MCDDPIVNEVRKAREELLAPFDYDLDAYIKDVMKRQYESGHKLVSLDRKTGEMVVVKEPQKPYGKEQ